MVGWGSIAQRHHANLAALRPGCEVRVLPSRPGPREGVPSGAFASLEEAVAWAPDVAIVANPATLHLAAAAPFAEAGVAVLIEKPLSVSLQGTEDLQRVCRAGGVTPLVGYSLRFHPVLRWMRDHLGEAVGRPLAARFEVGQHLDSWRPGRARGETVSGRPDLGGGALLELSHELDLACWFFGEPTGARARFGRSGTVAPTALEDQVDAWVEFGTLCASIHMDMVDHDGHRAARLIGTEGTLVWSGEGGSVRVAGREGREVAVPGGLADRNDLYRREMEAFLRHAETGGPADPGLEDGLRVLRLIEALRKDGSRPGGPTP